MIRDPPGNIRSILNRLEFSGHLRDLEAAHWENLPTDQWHLIFDGTGLGTRRANYIETLVNRWNLALKLYRKHRERIHMIRYKDFLADKARTIQKLAGQLGLGVQRDIRASVDIQYQSKGELSVSWGDFSGRTTWAGSSEFVLAG